ILCTVGVLMLRGHVSYFQTATRRFVAYASYVSIILLAAVSFGLQGGPQAPKSVLTECGGPALRAQIRPRLIEDYGKLPLSFEGNQGQVDAGVKFLSRGRGYGLFLTSNEAVL